MNTTSFAERLASRLSRKLAKRGPVRSDFVVADYRVLDGDRKTAKILIEYDEAALGQPSREEIISSVASLYKSPNTERPRIIVDASSVRVYPQHQAITCNVQVPIIRRPHADIKRFGLKPIVAGTVYLGEEMGDTWTVAESEGSVFIQRVEKDDIEKIIRERSKANSFRVHAGRTTTTLARVEAASGTNLYSVGDRVKVAHLGGIKNGEILGLTEGAAQVRFRDGSQVLVSASQLHGLVEAGEASQAWNKAALKEYYRKAYGYSDADLEKLTQYID